MNKRIKQLWSDAAESTNGDSWAEQTAFMEKFAELIVQECIAQAVKEEERYDSLGGRDAEYCSAAMANFQGVLAEHFGVEE